jgi:methyl-accepting chemotaxis protein
MPTRRTVRAAGTIPNSNHSPDRPNHSPVDPDLELQLRPLVQAIKAAQSGDLTVRLSEENGLGEVAILFNEWMNGQENFVRQVIQVSQYVGEAGQLNERLVLETTHTPWISSAQAINGLIDHLTYPLTEAERVLGAIAKGICPKKCCWKWMVNPSRGNCCALAPLSTAWSNKSAALSQNWRE